MPQHRQLTESQQEDLLIVDSLCTEDTTTIIEGRVCGIESTFHVDTQVHNINVYTEERVYIGFLPKKDVVENAGSAVCLRLARIIPSVVFEFMINEQVESNWRPTPGQEPTGRFQVTMGTRIVRFGDGLPYHYDSTASSSPASP